MSLKEEEKENSFVYLFFVFLSFNTRKIDPNPKLPPLPPFFPACFCGLNWYELQQTEEGEEQEEDKWDDGSATGRGLHVSESYAC